MALLSRSLNRMLQRLVISEHVGGVLHTLTWTLPVLQYLYCKENRMILSPKCRNKIVANEFPMFVLNGQKLMFVISKVKYVK